MMSKRGGGDKESTKFFEKIAAVQELPCGEKEIVEGRELVCQKKGEHLVHEYRVKDPGPGELSWVTWYTEQAWAGGIKDLFGGKILRVVVAHRMLEE
jgi:hypothetical protein